MHALAQLVVRIDRDNRVPARHTELPIDLPFAGDGYDPDEDEQDNEKNEQSRFNSIEHLNPLPYRLPIAWIADMAAGDRSTPNRAGKIRKMIGMSILVPILLISSSSFCLRYVRTV